MPRQQIMIFAGIGALLVVVAAAYFFWSSPTSTAAVKPGAVPIAADDHTMGSPNAPVTLIEYAAPSCPVCAAFDAMVFPALKASYIDTGKVYYVFRVFPLRPADGAAEAMARCLPKENYFAFIQLLFQKQAQWDPEFGIEDAHGALLQIGRVAGLPAEQANRCIEDKAMQKRINDIAVEGQTRFQIQATPTLIVNGEVQSPGAIPWEQLQPIIDEALKKAAAPASH